jgi:hypothetical protein
LPPLSSPVPDALGAAAGVLAGVLADGGALLAGGGVEFADAVFPPVVG